MAQINGMEKRNFTNSTWNGGKTAEMRNNSAKIGMVGMSAKGDADNIHRQRLEGGSDAGWSGPTRVTACPAD